MVSLRCFWLWRWWWWWCRLTWSLKYFHYHLWRRVVPSWCESIIAIQRIVRYISWQGRRRRYWKRGKRRSSIFWLCIWCFILLCSIMYIIFILAKCNLCRYLLQLVLSNLIYITLLILCHFGLVKLMTWWRCRWLTRKQHNLIFLFR